MTTRGTGTGVPRSVRFAPPVQVSPNVVRSAYMQNSLFDHMEDYFTHCRAERLVAEPTIAKYRDCLRAWLLPHLGGMEAEALGIDHVTKLRIAMVRRRLSVNRQYSIILCLKGYLKYLRERCEITTLDPNKIRLPRRQRPDVQFLTDAEVDRLIAAIDLHTFTGSRLRALVELLLGTGMRISEALALDRDTFDTDREEADVVGKGQRRRTVFFSARCRAWVRSYLSKRLDDHPALFVTTGYPATRFRREDVSRFFILLRRRASIGKRLTPHLLRHTFCTKLSHNGVDIALIRDLAGHADIQTTARYYLGRDPSILKRVHREHLDFGTPSMPTS